MSQDVNLSAEVIIIGGGAAGCFAAITAAQAGATVTLLERNEKLGRKLYITGKGRCNVTNDCTVEETLKNIPHNSRFLTSAMTRCPPQRVKEIFMGFGVQLKTERGNRVFPISDKSADIIDALLKSMRRVGVSIVQDRAKALLLKNGNITGVHGERGTYYCKAVVLATGGLSYPKTGSTGDGYRMAAEAGHTIIPTGASLVPLVINQSFCSKMQGLSLRNVGLKVQDSKKKTLFQDQGEMLFTHFGISGPLVLSASAHMREFESEHYTAQIDMKPALDEKTLDARLLRELNENANRNISHVLEALLPRTMIPIILELAAIPNDLKANSITKAQRRRVLERLKCLSLDVCGPRPVDEAVVTTGGIKISEVNPKTMESKIVKGLYFAGEILDVDAYTGGFNLQIAWATGHAAGEAAAEKEISL